MAKKKTLKTIPVPMHLAKLLTSEPEDLKDPKTHGEMQEIAKACLRILMIASR